MDNHNNNGPMDSKPHISDNEESDDEISKGEEDTTETGTLPPLDFNNIRGGMDADLFENRLSTSKPKGYLQAYKKHFSEFYYDMMASNPELYFDNDTDTDIIDWLNAKNGTGTASKYCFITVNFDNTKITIDDLTDQKSKLNNVIRKAMMKKCIGEVCYNFEQRGSTEDTLGTGIHMNILLEKHEDYTHKKPSQIRDEFYRTFKKFVGNSQHVFMRYNVRDDKFIKYLEGWKKDEDKIQMVLCDFIWRDKHGLEDVYDITDRYISHDWNFRFSPEDFNASE